MNDNHPAEVLVVEDDPFVREFAVMMLEDHGFQVRAAECADEALSILSNHGDETLVVFTDVQMPGELDGVQLAHIVCDRWPSVTVLVTSGMGASMGSLPVGTRFFPKPWNVETVVSAVRTSVARRG